MAGVKCRVGGLVGMGVERPWQAGATGAGPRSSGAGEPLEARVLGPALSVCGGGRLLH